MRGVVILLEVILVTAYGTNFSDLKSPCDTFQNLLMNMLAASIELLSQAQLCKLRAAIEFEPLRLSRAHCPDQRLQSSVPFSYGDSCMTFKPFAMMFSPLRSPYFLHCRCSWSTCSTFVLKNLISYFDVGPCRVYIPAPITLPLSTSFSKS